jgi:hypothetical protein
LSAPLAWHPAARHCRYPDVAADGSFGALPGSIWEPWHHTCAPRGLLLPHLKAACLPCPHVLRLQRYKHLLPAEAPNISLGLAPKARLAHQAYCTVLGGRLSWHVHMGWCPRSSAMAGCSTHQLGAHSRCQASMTVRTMWDGWDGMLCIAGTQVANSCSHHKSRTQTAVDRECKGGRACPAPSLADTTWPQWASLLHQPVSGYKETQTRPLPTQHPATLTRQVHPPCPTTSQCSTPDHADSPSLPQASRRIASIATHANTVGGLQSGGGHQEWARWAAHTTNTIMLGEWSTQTYATFTMCAVQWISAMHQSMPASTTHMTARQRTRMTALGGFVPCCNQPHDHSSTLHTTQTQHKQANTRPPGRAYRLWFRPLLGVDLRLYPSAPGPAPGCSTQ